MAKKKKKKNTVKIDVKQFEANIGYEYRNKKILIEALTHSSYANEHKHSKLQDNERLEFLGDAVLDLVISDYLYRTYTQLPEGDLSKLRASIVCEPFLAKAAKEIQLGSFILLGKGEELTGGRKRISILADAFEAIIGSIYIDCNLEKSGNFIENTIIKSMNSVSQEKLIEDYKTHLQELVQKDSSKPLSYVVTSEQGPDHNKQFDIQVHHDGCILGEGNGKTKKQAEQKAAYIALQKIWKDMN